VKAIEGMKAAGVNVHVQTPEERAAWIEATKPVWKQFEAQIGPDLLSRLQSYSK
jgi:C4-dicarboxylate-binding protein DctP